MSVSLKAAAWARRFKETKNDSPVHRTPGSLDSPVLRTFWIFKRAKFCDSQVKSEMHGEICVRFKCGHRTFKVLV